MTRSRSLLAAAVLALGLGGAIAGCGGSDSSDDDPQDVVDATLNNDEQISSGVLDISVDASAGDQGSFEASLSGPFQGDPDDPTSFPQLDLTGSISGEGAGQTVDYEAGLTVTEDNAFIEYGGDAYEVGTDTFTQFKDAAEKQAAIGTSDTESGDASASFQEGCEQAIEAQGGDGSACDFDISGWFTDLSNDGTEEAGGTDTTHVSGNVDVAQMLTDIVGLASTLPNAQGQIDDSQVDQAEEAITDASFDIYSGTDDDLLRKLDLNISIDPSAIDSPTPVPVESVDFGLSVEISDVNEDQTIEAPSDAKPLDDLLGQFGGLGALGGLGGLDTGGTGGFDTGGTGGLDTGGGTGNSDAYLQCVADAGNDPEKAADCLDQL